MRAPTSPIGLVTASRRSDRYSAGSATLGDRRTRWMRKRQASRRRSLERPRPGRGRDPRLRRPETTAFRDARRRSRSEMGRAGGAPKFPQPMIVGLAPSPGVRGREGARSLACARSTGWPRRHPRSRRWRVRALQHRRSMACAALREDALGQRPAAPGDAGGLAADQRGPVPRCRCRLFAEYLLGVMCGCPTEGSRPPQDADSEGCRGPLSRRGPWDELTAAVGAPVADALGASAAGNWEGTNVLWRPEPLATVARRHDLSTRDLERAVANARPILRAIRNDRVRPPPTTRC